MKAYGIVIYFNEFKPGIVGPTIWASSYKEAQTKADAMYPNLVGGGVVVEEV